MKRNVPRPRARSTCDVWRLRRLESTACGVQSEDEHAVQSFVWYGHEPTRWIEWNVMWMWCRLLRRMRPGFAGQWDHMAGRIQRTICPDRQHSSARAKIVGHYQPATAPVDIQMHRIQSAARLRTQRSQSLAIDRKGTDFAEASPVDAVQPTTGRVQREK